MTGRDRSEEVLRELRSLVDEVDPVPAEVTAFAKAALGWRRIDADLAELLSDSALEPETAALTRSGGGAGCQVSGSTRLSQRRALSSRPEPGTATW